MGPVAGVATELCKVLLKLVLKGTTTAFVGDFANFVVGCSLVLPASILYYIKKNRKIAIAGLAVGTVVMTIFGSGFNALYLLPKFSELFGMPMDCLLYTSYPRPRLDPAWYSVVRYRRDHQVLHHFHGWLLKYRAEFLRWYQQGRPDSGGRGGASRCV